MQRAAALQVLPTLWFRNTWSQEGGGSKASLAHESTVGHGSGGRAHHTDPLFQESLPDYFLYCDDDVPLLFTENETNNARLFGPENASPYVKDAINNFIVHGDAAAVNPAQRGTKVAAHHALAWAPARRATCGCVSRRVRPGARGPAIRRFRCGVRGAPRRGRRILRVGHCPKRAQAIRSAPT